MYKYSKDAGEVDGAMSQTKEKTKTIHVEDILIAYQSLKDVVAHTPLQKNERLSENTDVMFM